MKRTSLWSVIVLATLMCTHAYSQTVGSISGTVFDPTNAALPGAQVTATNQGTNVTRATITDDAGYFVFNLLPIGTYSVQVERSGFNTAVQKGISLEGQQNIRLEFKLVVGSVSTSVNVTAEGAEEVERVDPTLEQTIHAEQVSELPLNGRDFVQLALLAPGTTRNEQTSDFLNQGTSSEVSFRGSVSLSVQGMSEAANDWRYDGIDDNELTAGGVGFLPQIDAIQEFNVLTYNYSAQYGSRAGSTVLVSSKSGTNAFHGTLFEFLRNQIFDARNFFNLPNQKSPYRQNEFGGSVGGPIIKNKTFFFGDFQTNRVNQAPPIFASLPTTAEVVNHTFTNPIFDPTNYTVNTGANSRPSYWNGTAYVLPAGEISSVGQAILNIFPAPNLPGTSNNYESTPVRTLRDDEWDFRVDHTFTQKDHIFARFSWDDAKQFNPSGLPGLGASSTYFSTTYFTTHPRNMALSETHIFSSHIVNQVTAGYNKDFNYIRGLGYGTEDGNNIGIPGSNLGDPATSGMDLIAMTGFNPIGDRLYSPYQGGTSIFHYLDALSVTKGNHTMVFGFDFRPMQQNGLGETYFHGYLDFTKNFTAQINSSGGFAATITDPASGVTGANGNPIASLLLGYPDSGDRSNQIDSGILGRRWKEYRGYGQDNWVFNSRLTLNLGVAYGVTTPLSEDHNRIANFDISTGNFYVAGTGDGITPGGNVFLANKYAGVSTDYSNIEPRIGFSFSPFGVSRTFVVRGGYGIFHDVSHLGVSGGIHQNPPYVNTYTFTTNDITPTRVIIPNSPIDGFPNNSAVQNPATYTGSLEANDKNFKQGVVQQYNLNIQQGLGNGTVVTLAYAGTHADRMDNNPSYNDATPGSGNNPAARRPFPQYQSIGYITGNGWTLYNSLQGKIERRTHGLYLLGSYTYAEATENGYSEGVGGTGGGTYYPLTTFANVPVSNGTGGIRSTFLNPRDDRGLSALVLRSDLVASVVYLLPVGKGQHYLNNVNQATDMLIGGWQTNMIFTTHSGYPLYFSQSTNTSGSGATNRPDVVPGCNLYAGYKTITDWFNPNCFATPTSETMGDAHRSYGYGPGRTNVDFSLYKNFAIYESQKIEFRSEFFNVLNHSQLGTPATGFGSGTFGSITTTVVNNRQIQFALKYIF